MSQFYKVVPVACSPCGGTQAWFIVHPDHDEVYGCICHTPLPPDAKIIGQYLDRPYRDDPLPLFDEVARKQWKRRNFIRNYGTEAYRRPMEVD